MAFQVGVKHLQGESLLWCTLASSDILSFFKLILGVMQLETDLICSPLLCYFSPLHAYQPHWLLWYLIATPWCYWTTPPSLQLSAKLFAKTLARSTRMGQWIDDKCRNDLPIKPCYGSSERHKTGEWGMKQLIRYQHEISSESESESVSLPSRFVHTRNLLWCVGA